MSLILTTLLAWAAHAYLVGLYFPYFTDALSLAFRLTHVIEIGLVMFFSFRLYFHFFKKISYPKALLIVLGTLAVIDFIFFRLANPDFTAFDIWHFVAAFSTVAISLKMAHKV